MAMRQGQIFTKGRGRMYVIRLSYRFTERRDAKEEEG